MEKPDLGPELERMTTYCTYCPKMCRFSCPTAAAEARETATPWAMMRLLELSRDGSVELDESVAEAFYHCTGCRRCQAFCRHDNDVPRALWKARSWAVENGFMPEAFEPMARNFESHGTPFEEPQPEIDTTAFDAEGSIAFWPDCSTVQHRPETIGRIGRLLARITGEKIRLIQMDDVGSTPCCGFPLTAAGIEDGGGCREDLWPSLKGVSFVWTDCPALAAWNHSGSSWPLAPRPDDPTMGHIFTLLSERLSELPPPENLLDLGDTLLHESCFVSRQIDALDDVQNILAKISRTPPEKMAYEGKESPCCGGRVHYRMLEPEGSEKAAATVLEALDRNQGQERMVTTSAMCHHALEQAGPDSLVTSLLELLCEAYDC